MFGIFSAKPEWLVDAMKNKLKDRILAARELPSKYRQHVNPACIRAGIYPPEFEELPITCKYEIVLDYLLALKN